MNARVLLSIVPLNLYRRHSRKAGKCVGGHAPDSRSYEPEELRRYHKKYFCPIYADGTLAGRFKRKNTQWTEWDGAKCVAADWEAAGAWDDHRVRLVLPEPPVPIQAQSPNNRVTIQLAANAYLANRASREIAESTLRKYRTLVKQLRAFAAARGYVMLDQFHRLDMDEFYESWRDGIRSKAKKLERLKGFFRFCVKRKWIAENPAADLDAPVGAGAAANRMPFTDRELTRIYDACDRLSRVVWKNDTGTGEWDGDDVKTMIMLLCWTGLRISDAATFDMKRVSRHPEGGANVFLRMHKTQGALFTWVDDWLYERLLARERHLGPRIFARGASRRLARFSHHVARRSA